MNKAITDGLTFTPPAFAAGLGAWSRQDGTPGSATWAGAANAAVVPADQDFGSCLEIAKTDNVTTIRFMGETPILPGCYLRVRARVKAIAGNLPDVRIAGWAGNGARQHVGGLNETGPTVSLKAYGRVVEISAIVGTGRRGGVDMPWGTTPVYGHFGIDLLGPNGGVVRIDDIEIEDVTSFFLRDMMDWVDVRDYGAIGNGIADDRAAFVKADQAANGGMILVPPGEYFIGSDLSISAPIRFQGRLKMPSARLALLSSFDFPTYADAFGDETLGLKKGIQALMGYTDHNTFDLCGRRVELTEPLSVADFAVPSWSNQRVISNGQINVVDGPAWNTRVVGSVARYDPADYLTLSNVANIANIEVGSRVSGAGVGREVYVRAVNVGAQSLTLSQPLYGGAGTRSYTFHRYRYALDFSGMEKCDRMNFSNIDFLLNGVGSGIMLAPAGEMFHIRDCYIVRPKDRGITSIGRGCQDILVDRCQFLSNEMSLPVQDRETIAINVNANDVKMRNNRFVRFAHFMVANGGGHIITGNHWFQGDGTGAGVRTAGLVLTATNVQTTITGNYIDNAYIEWANEHDAAPHFFNEYSFGGLTITGNTFLCHQTQRSFAFLVVKPYGPGHFLHGLTVSDNVFKARVSTIERVEKVDTTFADLDYSRMRNVKFDGNTFNGIDSFVANPITIMHDQGSAQAVWDVPTNQALPFNGWAKHVDSLIASAPILNSGNQRVADMPFVQREQGAVRKNVRVNWTQPVRGSVVMRVRMDNPD